MLLQINLGDIEILHRSIISFSLFLGFAESGAPCKFNEKLVETLPPKKTFPLPPCDDAQSSQQIPGVTCSKVC